MSDNDRVLILGGGIGGLTFALELEKRGIPFTVFEAAPEFKPLGVGINLLPHAMSAFAGLGLLDALMEKGIETKENKFFTHHGQLVDQEPRGRAAGYDVPQCSIHRADLHEVLVNAVIARAGRDAIVLGHKGVSVSQDGGRATVQFADSETGQPLPEQSGAIVVGCDGVHSVVRKQFHSEEAVPRYVGSMNYRGTSKWKPYLTGATMIYVGTAKTGKLIAYPVRDDIDGQGMQLINWVVELKQPNTDMSRNWNRTIDVEEIIGKFEDCRFDFLDVPAMMRAAEHVFEYPLCDQDTLPYWTAGRITLLGDAAHPIMPRGSNGAAQAIIDANVLAGLLDTQSGWPSALKMYDDARREKVHQLLQANRTGRSPDAILDLVEQRTGGERFADINDIVPLEERLEFQAQFKQTAGFSREQVQKRV